MKFNRLRKASSWKASFGTKDREGSRTAVFLKVCSRDHLQTWKACLKKKAELAVLRVWFKKAESGSSPSSESESHGGAKVQASAC